MRCSSHAKAVLIALGVTFLWSTSWVLIKMGLQDLPPLTFAGLRYGMAFLILAPGAWKRRDEIRRLTGRQWVRIAMLGVVFYTLTQGGQFLALSRLDAIPFSLMLNATSILVALAGIGLLGEWPVRMQWAGMVVFSGGVLLYFLPLSHVTGSFLGFLFAGLTVGANAAAALLGRSVNRQCIASPRVVTAISMGIGMLLLLGLGVATEAPPALSLGSWGIILWLAVVNTAVAFTLWNRSLRTLTAMESSIINNTMLIQIAVLSWLFLGERLSGREIVGLMLAALGILIVQWRRRAGPPSVAPGSVPPADPCPAQPDSGTLER